MEFNLPTTVVGFVVLLAIIVGGTATSPMAPGTKLLVSAGLVVFGALTLVLGIKHGEYRAVR